MTIDLTEVGWEDFERIVAALLTRSGFAITDRAKPGRFGPDFVAKAPTGDTVFVQAKHFRQPLPQMIVAQFADDVARFRLQSPGARGLFVLSGPLSRAAHARINVHPELEVWTGEDVARRLEENPDISAAMLATAKAQAALAHLVDPQEAEGTTPPSAEFASRLARIKVGKTDWRSFEVWCAEILTEIFRPALGPPDLQTRTDDGLDIMDAIFPIRGDSPPWSLVRSEYSTRFAVAEFKNYSDPIGQKQVESIAQYLWKAAKRQFGILISRDQPGASAVAQRRRAWLQEEKMIAMLTDRELIEMLETKETGGEPFTIIDAQLEEFLRTLSP